IHAAGWRQDTPDVVPVLPDWARARRTSRVRAGGGKIQLRRSTRISADWPDRLLDGVAFRRATPASNDWIWSDRRVPLVVVPAQAGDFQGTWSDDGIVGPRHLSGGRSGVPRPILDR